MNRGFTRWIWVAALLIAFAAVAQHDVASTRTQSNAVALTLTETERQQLQQWQLTAQEWQRFKTLRLGVTRALGAPELSPIEILGIHAETDAERRRYAERWTQMRVDYARKSLAWLQARADAREKLYGGAPIIDERRLPGLSGVPRTADYQVGDRLMLFIDRDCPACEPLLPKLVMSIVKHAGVGLDIYFLDTAQGDEDLVRAWAQERRLPMTLVRDRRITLNHDNGLLGQLVDTPQVPVVLRRRGEAIDALPVEALGR